ncbi:MAG: alpha-E domain-containing protein [Halofilum sp. (in: g-proteobacteria)]
MSNLLSRYADAIFWMARYVERAEDLARVLDVTETFSRDSRGGQDWRSILELYDDAPTFFREYGEATAAAVIRFYTLDDRNGSSILSNLGMARSNARTLRPLISTEMWTQLNIFYNRLRALGPQEIAEPRLARFCSMVKEGCQTHTGITEGTFYRDEGWCFYQLGKQLERADQTTRLLDSKYHNILPSSEDVGSQVDVSRWNALLRSAAGYHAFRKIHPRGMTPADVAGFMLFHEQFPRSVAACVSDVGTRLTELRSAYNVPGATAAMGRLDDLRTLLDTDIEGVIEFGLHEYLDRVQQYLNALSIEIGRDLLGHAPASATAP